MRKHIRIPMSLKDMDTLRDNFYACSSEVQMELPDNLTIHFERSDMEEFETFWTEEEIKEVEYIDS